LFHWPWELSMMLIQQNKFQVNWMKHLICVGIFQSSFF